MKNNYTRYQGKSDDVTVGTFVSQTSGNAHLTGDSSLVYDFNYHSYQVVPTSGTHSGEFQIQVSNDNSNWLSHYTESFETTSGANITYSDKWLFKYARPILSGDSAGYYLINEIHGKL